MINEQNIFQIHESDDVAMREFKTKLDKHDWYYMMSDDDRSYDRGKSEEADIHKLINKIGKKAEELYQQAYKKNFPNSKHVPKVLESTNLKSFKSFLYESSDTWVIYIEEDGKKTKMQEVPSNKLNTVLNNVGYRYRDNDVIVAAMKTEDWEKHSNK